MRSFIKISIFLLIPWIAFAQVETFQRIPGLENVNNLTTEQYINALYTIAITVAAVLAVLKLIWAGVQYMLSEVVTSKQKAKQDIWGALLGLLIILAAVTLLNTINPQLTNLSIFRNASPVQPAPEGGGDAQAQNQQNCRNEESHLNEFGMMEYRWVCDSPN